jgi:hypothetical protein
LSSILAKSGSEDKDTLYASCVDDFGVINFGMWSEKHRSRWSTTSVNGINKKSGILPSASERTDLGIDAAKIPLPANFQKDLLVNFIAFPFYSKRWNAGSSPHRPDKLFLKPLILNPTTKLQQANRNSQKPCKSLAKWNRGEDITEKTFMFLLGFDDYPSRNVIQGNVPHPKAGCIPNVTLRPYAVLRYRLHSASTGQRLKAPGLAALLQPTLGGDASALTKNYPFALG